MRGQNRVIAGDGFFKTAELGERIAAIALRADEPWLDRQDAIECRQRLGAAAEIQEHIPAAVEHFEIGRRQGRPPCR